MPRAEAPAIFAVQMSLTSRSQGLDWATLTDTRTATWRCLTALSLEATRQRYPYSSSLRSLLYLSFPCHLLNPDQAQWKIVYTSPTQLVELRLAFPMVRSLTVMRRHSTPAYVPLKPSLDGPTKNGEQNATGSACPHPARDSSSQFAICKSQATAPHR